MVVTPKHSPLPPQQTVLGLRILRNICSKRGGIPWRNRVRPLSSADRSIAFLDCYPCGRGTLPDRLASFYQLFTT